ncbi:MULTISPECIES: hypothetical protein [unclassified Clostridioides]|uniref:hypothetical protein n=1 Tax=unclassified Clostridioides TaxID=2635829 RepID=UPI0038A6A4B8
MVHEENITYEHIRKTEFINKIASEIKSESKSMSRYESLLKATEVVKEMEKREEYIS